MARPPQEGDGEAFPGFDEAWVEAAPVKESEIRQLRTPPTYQPMPWRTWTPPQGPLHTGQARGRPPSRPLSRAGVGPLGILLIVSVTAAVTALVMLNAAGTRTSPHPSGAPAAGGRAQVLEPTQPRSGQAQPRPSRSPHTVGPSRRAGPRQHAPPTSAHAGLPWQPASSLPKGTAVLGLDMLGPGVLAGITSGECLAQTQPGFYDLVGCSGPHTDEVTSVQDITRRFPTRPTYEEIQALFEEACPAAARRWTGGDDARYVAGYLWWFEDGVPGHVVRRFLCTVSLAGNSPFTGTLRGAAGN